MSRFTESNGYGDIEVPRSQPPPPEYEKKGDAYVADSVNIKGAGGEPIVPREEETIRALKPRQISMIAIGGAIGESPRISTKLAHVKVLVSLLALVLL